MEEPDPATATNRSLQASKARRHITELCRDMYQEIEKTEKSIGRLMKVDKIKHLLKEMDSFFLLCERDRSEVFSSILRGDFGEATKFSTRLDTTCTHARALAKEIDNLLHVDEERLH